LSVSAKVQDRSVSLYEYLLGTPSGMLRVLSDVYLRLLAPWTTRLLSQWMLHWWRVNGNTARELFLEPTYERRARGWTDRKYRESNPAYQLLLAGAQFSIN